MKKILVLGFGLLGGVFFGTLMASTQGGLKADSEVLAAPCPDIECAASTFGGCDDNPGGHTECNLNDDENGYKCATRMCE